jgi:hypothetical protein
MMEARNGYGIIKSLMGIKFYPQVIIMFQSRNMPMYQSQSTFSLAAWSQR